MTCQIDTSVSIFCPKRQKIAIILLLLFLCFPGVMAQTVSFADPDVTTHKDLLMFNSTGHLVGTYNMTTTGIDITDLGDVMFVAKPAYSTPWDNPPDALASFFAYVQTYWMPLTLVALMLALLLSRR